MKRSAMVSTEIILDVVMQIQIKLPLEIGEEEARHTIMGNLCSIVKGVTLDKKAISELFDVPYEFVVSKGLLDDAKPDTLRVTTWKEERE